MLEKQFCCCLVTIANLSCTSTHSESKYVTTHVSVAYLTELYEDGESGL